MAIRSNTFDAGTHGAGVLASGSEASGDAFAGTVALNYDSTAPAFGPMGAITTGTTAAYARAAFTGTGTARARLYFRCVGTIPTGADFGVMSLTGSDTLRKASWHINAAGKLRLSDASGTSGVFTAAAAVSADTWYRLEIVAVAGSTTSDGTLKGACYLAGSSTPIDTFTTTTANLNGVSFEGARCGRYSSGTFSTQIMVDQFSWDDSGTDFIGEFVAPIVGTPTNSGPLWKIDATGLTGGVGAITHSISPSAGVVESSEGVFWVPQDTVDTDYTVTSTDGASPVDHVITVPAAGVAADTIRRRVWTGTVWD